MNNESNYKKPDVETFRKVVSQCGGNLTKVSQVFGINRSTIWYWAKADKEFNQVIKDERAKIFDECLVTARTVAMGVPAYETEYDENGDPVIDPKTGKPKKKFVGWVERPDGQMMRYLMSTIGRSEGFGDSPVDESDGTVKNGVPIRVWIEKMNQSEQGEE